MCRGFATHEKTHFPGVRTSPSTFAMNLCFFVSFSRFFWSKPQEKGSSFVLSRKNEFSTQKSSFNSQKVLKCFILQAFQKKTQKKQQKGRSFFFFFFSSTFICFIFLKKKHFFFFRFVKESYLFFSKNTQKKKQFCFSEQKKNAK